MEHNGTIAGVRYRGRDGVHELRAALVVGADGRFSRLRRLAGLEATAVASPMDVLWFNLPRSAEDPAGAGALFRFGRRSLVVFMDHFDHWQVGYLKGSYAGLRAAGLPALRRATAEIAPEFAARLETVQDWQQCALLSVEASRVRRWYRPGLLLIGDAAHVISPVGGVGINCALQDAVVAANVLAQPLRSGRVRTWYLRAVQRRRAGRRAWCKPCKRGRISVLWIGRSVRGGRIHSSAFVATWPALADPARRSRLPDRVYGLAGARPPVARLYKNYRVLG